MTPFERALRDQIQAEGGISVEAYMDACNAHYYATRNPLGAAGDFTTSPEMSQLFGEMVGAALADCWQRAGGPKDAVYAELGPGGGTLAADALRVLRRSSFGGAVHLVETSPVLRAAQQSLVSDAIFHDRIEDLPDSPLLLIANEFLDALPIRQIVDGIERRVVITDDALAFDRDGDVVEQSPAREVAVEALSAKLARSGGAAILIDYGHAHSAAGDTLQAVRGHAFAHVLADPGEQDLTAHVDFQAVAEAAKRAGASVSPLVTQGAWLDRLGIAQRARQLTEANAARGDEIACALERLTARDAMGELFKVIALHGPGWPRPAGF